MSPARDRPGVITADDLDDLMLGGTLFTSGGSRRGSTTVLDWTRTVLEESGPVPLRDAADLPAGVRTVAVGMAGSATMIDELLPAGDEFVRAVRALAHHLGVEVGAILPLNTGGNNALFPVCTAALLGVPLLDADGIGRTFAMLEGTTFRLGGVAPTPMALAGSSGQTVLVDTYPGGVEALTRPLVLACGGWVAVAMYPMTAATAARTAIAGSVSRTLEAGRVLAEATLDPGLAHRLGGTQLAVGTVLSVSEHDSDTASAQPAQPVSVVVRDASDTVVRLEARNEIAVALVDGQVAASAPDCICLFGLPGRHLLDIERVEPGMELEVIVIPAAAHWNTPEGRRIAGPAAYGFLLD